MSLTPRQRIVADIRALEALLRQLSPGSVIVRKGLEARLEKQRAALAEVVMEGPSAKALQVAAAAWCGKETSSLVMDEKLASEFARIIDRYREALIWCSGSGDFSPGGKARKGWLKGVRELL